MRYTIVNIYYISLNKLENTIGLVTFSDGQRKLWIFLDASVIHVSHVVVVVVFVVVRSSYHLRRLSGHARQVRRLLVHF